MHDSTAASGTALTKAHPSPGSMPHRCCMAGCNRTNCPRRCRMLDTRMSIPAHACEQTQRRQLTCAKVVRTAALARRTQLPRLVVALLEALADGGDATALGAVPALRGILAVSPTALRQHAARCVSLAAPSLDSHDNRRVVAPHSCARVGSRLDAARTATPRARATGSRWALCHNDVRLVIGD